MTTDTERALRFSHGVQPLFDVLHRRARRLTRCDADAEDLVQETLMYAYAGFDTFQDGTNLRAWLLRILYNRWVSTHRGKQCRPTEVAVDFLTELDLTDHTATPGARSAEDEFMAALPDGEIKAALATLPTGFSEVVYYTDIQGYTYAETAALLNIPHGTVMSRASRGRRRLRLALAPVSVFDEDPADIVA
jgi:RNA polymerase sigma-70 factor (ECF subfamily)